MSSTSYAVCLSSETKFLQPDDLPAASIIHRARETELLQASTAASHCLLAAPHFTDREVVEASVKLDLSEVEPMSPRTRGGDLNYWHWVTLITFDLSQLYIKTARTNNQYPIMNVEF